MSRVISSGTELGLAAGDLELVDMDAGVDVLLDETLTQNDDRVLEVVAAPRHVGDEHVPAERELSRAAVAGTVGERMSALVDRPCPRKPIGRWLTQVPALLRRILVPCR